MQLARAALRRVGVIASGGLLCLAAAAGFPAQAASNLTQFSLEQLLDTPIVGASKYEQKQSEVAAAASVITRDQIRLFGWRTLGEALQSLPGVYTTYDRQYTYLGVRGFGLPGDYVTRLKLTINGNSVNNDVFDQAPMGREFPLDMDLVERIEFIPGPGGAVYGQNAMLGVINVVTRTGASVNGAEADVGHQWPQSLNEGRATWGKVLENGFDVLLSVSGMGARGQDLTIDFPGAGPNGATVSGVARRMDGEGDKQVFARVARGPWSFDLVLGDRRKDDPTAAYSSDPLVPGTYQRDRYALSQVLYEDRFAGDTLDVYGRLFIGDYRYYANESYGTYDFSTASGDWHGVELRALSTAVAAHKLMLGLEAQDNVRYDQTIQSVANPAAYHIVVPGSGYRAGIYFQDEWRLAQTLTATLGVRVDRDNVTGTQWSPRAGLIWQEAPSTTLKALYGRAHRSPNAFERDYGDNLTQTPNYSLKGETIDTLEIVADHRIERDLSVRASVYHWTLHDIVALGIDPVTRLTQYQTAGSAQADGTEWSADKTWDTGARLKGSVSYQYARRDDTGHLENSPRLLAKLDFSGPLPVAKLRIGYQLQYDSKRLGKDGTELGGYAVSNLNLVADEWAKGLEASLGIYNLLDKHYSQPAADFNWQTALEQDGRTVLLKLGYRL
jgi:outer membrane receptor for ferrienterochelin and colicin